ncbi:MAG TPA: fructose-specific PTS transporter subunit EIIC [Streptomyces sp.]|nr:fructose-specific PTS transporter subunit EIIC [Streptomyces sp.]
MSDVISAELVDLDLSAGTREAAAHALAARMAALGRVTDLDGFLADVAAREERMPTGLDGGIGIPHCRSAYVTEPTLAFGRCAAGIDFGAADGPADLVFLIAAPAGADDAHLTMLSALARKLTNPEFTAALRSAREASVAAALIRGDADPAAGAVAPATPVTASATDSAPDPAAASAADPAPGPAPGPCTARAMGASTACPSVPEPAAPRSAVDPTGVALTAVDPAVTEAAVEPTAVESAVTDAAGAEPTVTDAAVTNPAATDSAATDPSVADPSASTAGPSTSAADPSASVVDSSASVADSSATDVVRTAPVGASAGNDDRRHPFRIVAVTSCPTGIAHTYMAAEALERAGRRAGVEVVVETQGSAGFTRLGPAVIAAADGVILAHDLPVREKDRFAGKPTVDVGVKAGINRPDELIADVRARAASGEATPGAPDDHGTPGHPAGRGDPAGPGDHGRPGGPGGRLRPAGRGSHPGGGPGTRLRAWLMSGVSHMVPFVAAGGLLIALGFAIGGYEINKAPSVTDHFAWSQADSWGALLFQTGGVAFAFLVPVLAGYIAYGMADRPGLVPGFVGGSVSLTINAGFLGGLAAGLIAGAVVTGIQRVRIPGALRGIMPVVVIPLLSSAVVGFLMFVVIGKPIASAQKAMTDWLNGLTGTNALLLGALLGLMMCFDLGGPVNKVAYTFATAGIAVADPSDSAMRIMAAVMAAGMVPPLAMALATTVRGRLFDRTERENGKAAWVLGASFISEGAIPFAAADPLRVIPASMAGGAVTGALSMAFDATLRAPHGGIFVVPLIGNPFPYLIAVAAGVGVSTALVVLLKGLRTPLPVTPGPTVTTGTPVPADTSGTPGTTGAPGATPQGDGDITPPTSPTSVTSPAPQNEQPTT